MHRVTHLLSLLMLASAGSAQLPITTPPSTTAPVTPAPATPPPAPADPFGRDTPRGCVMGFLKAAEREDYAEAAQYLDTRASASKAQELARELQIVLNRGPANSLAELSRAPEGNLKDGLRNNRDRVEVVETASEKLDILLDRVQRGNTPAIWLFSPETLARIPRVFDEINTPGIERFFPRSMREVKFLSLPLWRWLGIILGLALAVSSASLVTRGLAILLRPLIRRVTGLDDDRYIASRKRPVQLILLAVAIRILAHFAVSVLFQTFWIQLSDVLAVVGFTWLLLQLSDVAAGLKSRELLRRQATNQLAVVALVVRLFKMLVLFLAVLLLLHGAGVNVSAMLAGLGIGGIALALAAQKTLENLFGGIGIITRNVVRVGDFCHLADETGTIEDIGLGSTRVRTLDRTVVSIPNAKVSTMNLENYSMRDKIWFHHQFGLRYETSAEQLRYVLITIAEMLRGNPKVENESARIRFIGFGLSSLNLEIFAYIKGTDYTAFLEIQEDLLMRIMDIIAESGTSIALPSQITYFDRDKRGREESRPAPIDNLAPGDRALPPGTRPRKTAAARSGDNPGA